ncbi:hypothetical protein GCM10009555_092340 [Acrocarpospora macrocephala]|uniref:DUF5666 domain-containing protein n=1 Tax=Acrocarpospora macrocephala TaxID=150177 RepID=A0A5M3WYW4_9ACTN|nr:hypothetical protein [Acrocarpospora macrocephala]GES14697.1 hypothetical protein Amac_082940 [Acrocarpospora macrocephala]
MRTKLALGAAATVATVFLISATAAADPAAPAAPAAITGAAYIPAGAYTIADSLVTADSTLRGPRLRGKFNRWVVGIHGSATVREKKNTFVTYTWQRGAITAKGAGTLTVKSRDGVTWTWNTATDTRFRRAGAKADFTKLMVGDWVFTIGVPGTPNPTATAVFVPKNKAVVS